MKKFFRGHVCRTLCLIILAAFLPALGAILYAELQSLRDIRDGLKEHAEISVEMVSSQVERMITHTQTTLATLAQVKEIRGLDLSYCAQILEDTLLMNKYYAALFIVNAQGEVVASTHADIRKMNLQSESYIQKVREQKSFVINEFALGYSTGLPTLYCAYPIFNHDNDLVGILVAGLLLEHNIDPVDHDFQSYSAMLALDDKGLSLYSHPENYFPAGTLLSDNRWDFLSSLPGNETGSAMMLNRNGQERLLAGKRLTKEYLGLPYLNLMMVVETDDILFNAYMQAASKGLTLLMAALAGMILAWFIGRRTLTRPLAQMTATALAFGQRDFSTCAALPVLGGEIGELCRTFEGMAKALEEHENLLNTGRVEADEANRIKTEFMANMSHEIRTPLNAIIGMAYMALKTDLDERQKNYLSKIYNSGNSLLGIINDILDFSKLETGNFSISNLAFHLDDVFNTISAISAPKAEEKNIEMLFYISPSVPQYLKGDPLRINQILTNLVSNAVKFTDKGEIMVSCSLLPRKPESGSRVGLHFVVQDTGIGIAGEQFSRLFKPFTQADGSLTRRYGGSGLGLVITKNLVELMGGEINVESSVGEGTKVTFTIHLEENLVQSSRLSTSGLQGMRVLLVDDNDTARQIIGGMLNSFSFQTDSASSASEAYQLISMADEEGKPYSMIYLDWRMPDIDGVEAASYITHHMNLRVQPKIMLITAFDQTKDHEDMSKNGIISIIHKPVNPSLLLDATLEVMDMGEPVQIENPEAESSNAEREPRPAPLSGAENLSVYDLETTALPGLNFKKALALYENKKNLLDMAIRGFVRDHAGGCKQMEEALFEGNLKDAGRIAHTMKSLCASIGAEDLTGQFAMLEAALTGDVVDYFKVKPAIRKAGEDLAITIELLKDMLARQDSPECARYRGGAAAPEEAERPEISQENQDILRKLHALMQDDDASAQALLAENLAALKADLPEKDLRDLERLVNQFEFEEAMRILDGLL
ncbi:MAG: ATP-binding protein [Desulfovibrionaceae bacterium]|nr:ATP-binding protein [Desulfovibrionaceae bacterium]